MTTTLSETGEGPHDVPGPRPKQRPSSAPVATVRLSGLRGRGQEGSCLGQGAGPPVTGISGLAESRPRLRGCSDVSPLLRSPLALGGREQQQKEVFQRERPRLWDDDARPASHCSERGGPSRLLAEAKGRRHPAAAPLSSAPLPATSPAASSHRQKQQGEWASGGRTGSGNGVGVA